MAAELLVKINKLLYMWHG